MAIVAKMTLVMILVSVGIGGQRVVAEDEDYKAMHHVVGGDRGWDPSTDVGSWSAGTTFRVGDKIWFTYSRVHGKIAELKTKEEYESCDVSNPIRMYTDGLDSVSLEEEGIRYFASSNSKSCKSGLKLHVEIMPSDSPKIITSEGSALALAAGPISSGSTQLAANCVFLIIGLLISNLI
ncbi:uclacyanin 1-like [Mercurialis annua]|uniref:uclacyanin 1-like n=1 Tax=Mercurialis annua TaxID=3986 RepID=UPI002160299E|nr:uclacyanin 1-like [Mercurialis annua]